MAHVPHTTQLCGDQTCPKLGLHAHYEHAQMLRHNDCGCVIWFERPAGTHAYKGNTMRKGS